MDIEDLKSLGKTKKICPFEISRGIAKNAKIVFLVYDYFLNNVLFPSSKYLFP